jgi:hypothetical protein
VFDIRLGLFTVIIGFRNNSINVLDLVADLDPPLAFTPACTDDPGLGFVDPELDSLGEALGMRADRDVESVGEECEDKGSKDQKGKGE